MINRMKQCKNEMGKGCAGGKAICFSHETLELSSNQQPFIE